MRKTTLHPLLLLLAILLLVLAASACQPLPPAQPTAELPAAALPAVATPVPPSATPGAATTAPGAPAAPTTPTATASDAPAQIEEIVEEEDCMAACHIPDANDLFGAGAGPQPAGHVARTVCLSCHSTAATPPMPTDHKGRMDPSCALCHKENATPG